jgi:hypothetical protein
MNKAKGRFVSKNNFPAKIANGNQSSKTLKSLLINAKTPGFRQGVLQHVRMFLISPGVPL